MVKTQRLPEKWPSKGLNLVGPVEEARSRTRTQPLSPADSTLASNL